MLYRPKDRQNDENLEFSLQIQVGQDGILMDFASCETIFELPDTFKVLPMASTRFESCNYLV